MSSKTISPEEAVTLTIKDKIAIIQLNVPQKLNAMNLDCYFRIASLLRDIAKRDSIIVTVLTGTGRYFSAYEQFSHPRFKTRN